MKPLPGSVRSLLPLLRIECRKIGNVAPDRNRAKFILLSYFFLIILFSLMAVIDTYAQSAQTISGKVTDERGEALAGAIIKIKGTTLATSSGKEGAFQIKVPSVNSTLVISFIGYQPLSGEYAPETGRLSFPREKAPPSRSPPLALIPI